MQSDLVYNCVFLCRLIESQNDVDASSTFIPPEQSPRPVVPVVCVSTITVLPWTPRSSGRRPPSRPVVCIRRTKWAARSTLESRAGRRSSVGTRWWPIWNDTEKTIWKTRSICYTGSRTLSYVCVGWLALAIITLFVVCGINRKLRTAERYSKRSTLCVNTVVIDFTFVYDPASLSPGRFPCVYKTHKLPLYDTPYDALTLLSPISSISLGFTPFKLCIV